MSLLDLKGVDVTYGDVQVLWGVSLHVGEKEIVSVVGANAAGKSTILNAISGLIPCRNGRLRFVEKTINGLAPHDRVPLGLIQIPEGRKIFPYMSVMGNLEMGSFNARARGLKNDNLRKVFSLFPLLEQRKEQLARTLSGGEQQMLAIGRGLMAEPKLLMMDEPSLGLAPIVVKVIFETIKSIHLQGIAVLLVEQNVKQSLELSHRGYALENGRLVLEGTGAALLKDSHLRTAYLGL
jgi:branched-chain amino acid transport system ATP-binding protein